MAVRSTVIGRKNRPLPRAGQASRLIMSMIVNINPAKAGMARAFVRHELAKENTTVDQCCKVSGRLAKANLRLVRGLRKPRGARRRANTRMMSAVRAGRMADTVPRRLVVTREIREGVSCIAIEAAQAPIKTARGASSGIRYTSRLVPGRLSNKSPRGKTMEMKRRPE